MILLSVEKVEEFLAIAPPSGLIGTCPGSIL